MSKTVCVRTDNGKPKSKDFRRWEAGADSIEKSEQIYFIDNYNNLQKLYNLA